jgi:adenine-specific DNA methylase
MTKAIDNDIPIKFISQISKREANSKKPIYKLHKWFGRKTDAIFRSILLAVETEYKDIEDLEKLYYEDNHNLLKGKIILDPFMGGGVTLVNALRFGGKVIGVDLNPVAWFITKNELQLPELKEYIMEYPKEQIIDMLKKEFFKIEKSVGNEIKELYSTEIYDNDKKIKKNVDIMYVLWVKKAICPKCGRYVRLFPNNIVARFHKKNFHNYKVCYNCGNLIKGNEENSICSNCNSNFNNQPAYKGRKFTCTACGASCSIVKDIMKKTKKTLSTEIYAIQYYDNDTKKQGFKIPDKNDLDKYNEVKEKVINLLELNMKFIPQSKIPQGYNTKQVQNHNYNFWREMFNYRQIYCLSRILEEISKISDNRLRELFLCVFSNTINTNNMFCIYNSQYGKIEPLFGDHHMAPVMNPVENNVWGTKLGRGTFIKNFKGLIESKKFNESPYERLNINDKNINIVLENEKFHSRFAESFDELKFGEKNTLIKCQGSQDLSFLPSNSIDAVITDPPYYSAINYGEISEFFYTWERLILKDSYEFFKPEHIPCNDEVTVNESKGITKEEYKNKLSVCFKETNRVLKKKSPLILTYNNSSTEGWCLLLEALIDADFIVEKTYPIYTEFNAGLIDNRREKMNYDLVIVAKVKEEVMSNLIELDEFIEKVEQEFEKTYLKLMDHSLCILDILLIKTGKVFELYSKYGPNIYKSDINCRVSLKNLLQYFYNNASLKK